MGELLIGSFGDALAKQHHQTRFLQAQGVIFAIRAQGL
jgi:hypothetical protein